MIRFPNAHPAGRLMVSLATVLLIQSSFAVSAVPQGTTPNSAAIISAPTRPTPDQQVRDVAFADDLHGSVLLEDHQRHHQFAIETSDGGNTWRVAALNVAQRFRTLSSGEAWAIQVVPMAENRVDNWIEWSQDGGQTWVKRRAKLLVHLNEKQWSIIAATFRSNGRGWLVMFGPDSPCKVLQTRDGGHTLSIVQSLENKIDQCLGVASSADSVWIYGSGLWRTDRGGETWTEVSEERPFPQTFGLTVVSAALREDGHGWITGSFGSDNFMLTNDSGATWSDPITVGHESSPLALTASDSQHVYLILGRGEFFASSDSGKTWTQEGILRPALPGYSLVVNKMVMLPSGQGWVVHDNGYLSRTTDSGRTWRELVPKVDFHLP